MLSEVTGFQSKAYQVVSRALHQQHQLFSLRFQFITLIVCTITLKIMHDGCSRNTEFQWAIVYTQASLHPLFFIESGSASFSTKAVSIFSIVSFSSCDVSSSYSSYSSEIKSNRYSVDASSSSPVVVATNCHWFTLWEYSNLNNFVEPAWSEKYSKEY